MKRNFRMVWSLTWLGAFLILSGCGDKPPATNDDSNEATDTAATTVDDHSGWWCVEHGVPEEECSICSSEAAKAFRNQGDWCEEHNRAESQCFKCDPSRAEKFAALYEAKYGKKPPAASE